MILQAFDYPPKESEGSLPLVRLEIRRKKGMSYSYKMVNYCLANFPVIVLYCNSQCFSHKSFSSSATGKYAKWAAHAILAMFSTPAWTWIALGQRDKENKPEDMCIFITMGTVFPSFFEHRFLQSGPPKKSGGQCYSLYVISGFFCTSLWQRHCISSLPLRRRLS